MTQMQETKSAKLSDAQVGDELIVVHSDMHRTIRNIATVKRITKTHLVVGDDVRFWRTGRNAGREVGNASRSFRSSYLGGSRRVAVPENDDEIAAVRDEMMQRTNELAEQNAKAKAEREAKLARRASRFEGNLERVARRLSDEVIGDKPVDDTADSNTKAADAFRFKLESIVWDIESNENDIRSAVADERRRLERIEEYLDSDYSLSGERVNYRLAEYIEKRSALIERGKDLMYFVNKIYFADES